MASSTTLPDAPVADIGDYVDIDDEHEVQDVSEPRERYTFDNKILSRWYCPIRIGDVLNQQYRIEHKLGWGGILHGVARPGLDYKGPREPQSPLSQPTSRG
ncbi:hypothetical protein O1611_g5862 [Lasiodiplodia mahajangana]|uniref:Uncharacterized protein n=1 Tax=Lasiodiplodia mahajangana TaxID=1108764 RepID=A0ACC2JJU0_9PEZI|nr:hypothetical protein O1611_g5862 [Lasiodiplodia mahajangana]